MLIYWAYLPSEPNFCESDTSRRSVGLVPRPQVDLAPVSVGLRLGAHGVSEGVIGRVAGTNRSCLTYALEVAMQGP